ncbi:MAG TPA: aromatic ring-hydroxylating dioxygenase subunit alpha [Micromonosporaceae bacterium]|jgi:Rieske 2Fe-2S family protein
MPSPTAPSLPGDTVAEGAAPVPATATRAAGSGPIPSAALAARYYTDPAVAVLETDHIFARTWQLACHESDLPAVGARIVAQVAGREVLVVRTPTGLAAHLNVCRHRGSRLVTGAEPEGKAIRCPYHGWTYHLDGTLVGAPEGRTIPCLDRPSLGLFPAAVESYLGLVFVNLDRGAAPLHEQLGGLDEKIGRYLGADLRPVGTYRIYDDHDRQDANWKVVLDNYLEGYHVPVAHPGLMRLLDYQRYTVETTERYAYFEVPLRDKPSSNLLERAYQRLTTTMPGLGDEDKRIWRYVMIYPNTLIDLYPDHVLAWKVTPHGVARAGLPGAFYARPGMSLRTRLAQRLNIKIGWITNDEDAELVARVQAGMSTPGWSPGPLSRREAGVSWFADRIRADLQPHLDATLDRVAT